MFAFNDDNKIYCSHSVGVPRSWASHKIMEEQLIISICSFKLSMSWNIGDVTETYAWTNITDPDIEIHALSKYSFKVGL